MKFFYGTIIVVIALLCAWAEGSPTGAPVEACASMTPGHGFDPQLSLSPFITIPEMV